MFFLSNCKTASHDKYSRDRSIFRFIEKLCAMLNRFIPQGAYGGAADVSETEFLRLPEDHDRMVRRSR